MAAPKGHPRWGGRKKGEPNKATATVRQVFAAFAQANAPRMEGWLAEVAAEDPAKAMDLFLRACEYHVPKLQKTTVTLATEPDEALLDELERREREG